ncbi:hypothetical protein D0Z07_2894 [Hyphodiscus hymeniophilus]|uniref:Uncharacterized protein n=1 Tax=Hyphodiscus hymeniophilus TaxID=353542 RepID=A0A9P7AYN7_9HELO|nr:hypothetical protein D0Z07_2894 [Hyphodiscus hymeniophilus]
MRYFVENLARWFDLCDYERHFALIVPKRAATCPMLLNAILAVSARHLSFLGRSDICDLSDFVRYQEQCLYHFIPSLNDSEAILDENILAATVILRYLEEVDVPLFTSETQHHLIGTRIFIRAQGEALVAGGLRQAAFWVAIRQEIYMALVNQRSVQPGFHLPPFSFDHSFSPADDCVWANRIVMHCADILRFCFGDDQANIEARHDTLSTWTRKWSRCRPESFSPTFYRAPDKSKKLVFPEIWYLEQCHVIATQHLNFCKILLAINNPKLRRLGSGSGHLWREVQVWTSLCHLVVYDLIENFGNYKLSDMLRMKSALESSNYAV